MLLWHCVTLFLENLYIGERFYSIQLLFCMGKQGIHILENQYVGEIFYSFQSLFCMGKQVIHDSLEILSCIISIYLQKFLILNNFAVNIYMCDDTLNSLTNQTTERSSFIQLPCAYRLISLIVSSIRCCTYCLLLEKNLLFLSFHRVQPPAAHRPFQCGIRRRWMFAFPHIHRSTILSMPPYEKRKLK